MHHLEVMPPGSVPIVKTFGSASGIVCLVNAMDRDTTIRDPDPFCVRELS